MSAPEAKAEASAPRRGFSGMLATLRSGRGRWAGTVLLALFALLIPPVSGLYEQMNPDVSAKFTIFLGTSALVLALWSVSYNLMLGYTGMVSFAHAAYYGVGAYTVAYLFKTYHLPVLEGLVVAPLVAAVFGLVTGLFALRAVRLYFSLLTLAISQLMFSIAFSWCAISCDNGYHGLALPDQLTDYTTLYYLVGAIVAVSLVAMFLIVRSPFGAALAAIRENRLRAGSIGLNVKAYELAIFTIASLFAGLAGGLFAVFQQEAYPEMMYWTANAQPIVVALLGGTGTFLGPALGAFIYTALDTTISKQFPYQFDIILGAIVLAVVLVVPGGFSAVPRLLATLRARVRRGGEPQPGRVESSGEAIRLIDVRKALQAEAIGAEPTATGSTILQLEDLSKAFGGLQAVRKVSLEVRQGDRHAIIGPNGAGKSTLFNLITGRLRPDRGRVLFDGRDITGKPAHVIARSGVGRAFQLTSIFPRLSVRQNLQYAMLAHRGDTRRPWGSADRIYRDDALQLLDAVGLSAYADLPAGQLSHGDQRAIEIAISLALGSKLVLLDEPTAGMSQYETEKAMELVRQLATERGLTVLFCEHDMQVVFRTARTVTVMHLGRILTQGTPDEVRSNPEVQKVYLGQLEEATA
ncbi:branched-chain amino acid ABC transporter ATP-binding protein/permease [Candidatus Nephthysia bennettiae]|uniref:Branched-chain amino acid ABC transporter ATP-binding protein/permease n=1 Tax=Candidatus Nephthysia bennettiae TaxID=3127016 RepID=A0A934K147_9BACT|nr:branched-chain amino acid ABC transporter ATP-binding protein/permease [Candidatus Dormibacteraeota bacterium]MBJ7613605.1 branched-chain amino acid ABC transporter ATP-binding protein/permease [Candidatus Dormibacteraeota bacterium]